MSIFDQFDKNFNVETIKSELTDIESNSKSGEYKRAPHGKYEVVLTKLELIAKKADGSPMVHVGFRISSGEHKGEFIDMYQVITKGFQLHVANKMIKSLESSVPVIFETYSQYGNMLIDIFQDVKDKLEYDLEYKTNDKGFDEFAILKVYDKEQLSNN